MASRRHTLWIVCLSGLLTVVALELALQGLSWIQHVRLAQQYAEQLRPQGSATAERRVLCVGDSFTFGIGASSKDTSYPAQLEPMLNADAGSGRWQVLNFGKGGMNSAEVVHALGHWLRRTQPAYVVLMIGLNDAWNTAYTNQVDLPSGDELDEFPADLAPWRWTFRTGRLATLVAHNLRHRLKRPPQAATDNPAGIPEPARDALPPADEDLSPPELLELAQRFLRDANDYERAEAVLRELINREPDASEETTLLLARALILQHKHADALALMEPLRERLLSAPDGPVDLLADLGWRYVDLGDRTTAQAIGEGALARAPEDTAALELLAHLAIASGEYETAEASLTRALSLEPSNPNLHVQQANLRIRTGRRLDDAYRDLVMSYSLSHDRDLISQELSHLFLYHPIDSTTFAQYVHERSLSTADGAALNQLFQTVRHVHEGGWPLRLRANMERIAQICARQQTPLILLSYPDNPTGQLNTRIRHFAADRRLPFVDVAVHLQEIADARQLAFDHFLMADRHPNDAGYEQIARLVAERLLMANESP